MEVSLSNIAPVVRLVMSARDVRRRGDEGQKAGDASHLQCRHHDDNTIFDLRARRVRFDTRATCATNDFVFVCARVCALNLCKRNSVCCC